jgi:gas vesicle protein
LKALYDLEAFLKDPQRLLIMGEASVLADEVYRYRQCQEQKARENQERWAKLVNQLQVAPTFRHPDEVEIPSRPGLSYILPDKAQPAKLPPPGKGRSYSEEQMTKITNPTFAVTPEERAKERAKEELDRLNYIEAEVIKSIVSVGDKEKQEIEESVKTQMGTLRQQVDQRKETNQTYQQVGDVVEKLRTQITNGDNSEETRSLFTEGCQLLRMMAKTMEEPKQGTIIAGTACASQCQSDILNSLNGRPDLSHGEIKNARKRGRPISEGRVS